MANKMSTPPSNTLPVALILHYIFLHPCALTTRASQDAFLTRLTNKHKFPYYSSTYGHTFHDPKSLRAVLVATVRNHGIKTGDEHVFREQANLKQEPSMDTSPWENESQSGREGQKPKLKADVEVLFRQGATVLDPVYVDTIMQSVTSKPPEEVAAMVKGLASEDSESIQTSDTDTDDELFGDIPGEEALSSDSDDEDYEPNAKEPHGNSKWARALGGKRKHVALGHGGGGEDEDGDEDEDEDGDRTMRGDRTAEATVKMGARKKARITCKEGSARRKHLPVAAQGEGKDAPLKLHAMGGVAANSAMYPTGQSAGLPASALQRLAMDPPVVGGQERCGHSGAHTAQRGHQRGHQQALSSVHGRSDHDHPRPNGGRRPPAPPPAVRSARQVAEQSHIQACADAMAVKMSHALREFLEDIHRAGFIGEQR